MLHHEHKGLGFIPILEPFQAEVSNDVCGVTGQLNLLAVIDHWRIVISTLAGKDIPIVIADRVGHEVPLSDDGVGVTRFLKKLGESLLTAIELAIAVVVEAVEVGVLAGLNDGTHGSTDGVRHQTPIKSNALFCQSIHPGGVQQLALVSVGADGLRGKVIAEDEEDIGLAGSLRESGE